MIDVECESTRAYTVMFHWLVDNITGARRDHKINVLVEVHSQRRYIEVMDVSNVGRISGLSISVCSRIYLKVEYFSTLF